MPFNVTGSPAMSVCCGFGDAGLPLSLQIVGKRFDDAAVLRLAHAYEQVTPWRDRGRRSDQPPPPRNPLNPPIIGGRGLRLKFGW
jgi:aspartyl-tRNA(Asn)/glutamyl-tRNA(Gln) amidotransferase subunit A